MDNYKNKWWILISAGLMILLINIDSTIVNVALAKISVSLKANLTTIQWVVSSYLLATAVFFTLFGRLADIYGNRVIFLIGTTIFTVASLLCGLSPSAPLLIAARFLQGIGFASTLGIALIMASNAFPPEQRGLANGASVTLTGLGQVAGPTLGGIILHFASWHWIFLINVPIGIVCLLMTLHFAPKDTPNQKAGKIDPLSVLLFIISIAIISVTLNQTAYLQTGNIILFLAIGVVLLGVFCYRSMRAKHPLIATVLLTNLEYLKVSFTRIIFMYVWMGTMLFIPLYLQNVIGFTPLKTGLLILVMSIMIAITSPLTGKLIDKKGFKLPTTLSMLLAAITMLLFSRLTSDVNMPILLTGFFIFGISTGLHIPATVNGVIQTSADQHRSTGVGLFFTIAFIGGIMGIAISGSYMTEKSWVFTLQSLVDQGITISQHTLDLLKTIASGAHDTNWLQGHVSHTEMNTLGTIAHHSFIDTFMELMWVNTVLALIGWFISSRIKHGKQ